MTVAIVDEAMLKPCGLYSKAQNREFEWSSSVPFAKFECIDPLLIVKKTRARYLMLTRKVRGGGGERRSTTT
jgi:hypothetical protein